MKLSLPMRKALLLLADDGDWVTSYRHRNLSVATFNALVARGLATRNASKGTYRISPEGYMLAQEFRAWQEDHARLDHAVIEVRRMYEDDPLTGQQAAAARLVHRLLVNKRNALNQPITIA